MTGVIEYKNHLKTRIFKEDLDNIYKTWEALETGDNELVNDATLCLCDGDGNLVAEFSFSCGSFDCHLFLEKDGTK